MQFVQGLPHGVYVGQSKIQHPQVQPSLEPALAGFNLALHVQDDSVRVQQHRMQLLNDFAPYGVTELIWMQQTHSTICHRAEHVLSLQALEGDGLVTQQKGQALMMMTADCLPIVLGNAQGTEVANLHAGWKGLAHGIIENTVAQMQQPPTWAWFGAAISQPCFEVGSDVKSIFCQKYPEVAFAFAEGEITGKFYAGLYAIAAYILAQHGVDTVLGGDQCSYQQADEYYSYRRHAKTGRMATFVFMQ